MHRKTHRKVLRQIGVLLATIVVVSSIVPQLVAAATFSDVPAGHPSYSAIESLKNLGVVKGYADGSFKPDQAVNRAEALKMVLLAAKVSVTPGLYQTDFPDVQLSDWFSGYVFFGQNLKIITGNPDGTFAPARQVNKAEFLKMTIRAFQVDLNQYMNSADTLSKDIADPGVWYFPSFNYAKTNNIIAPTFENNLEPGKLLSRAACAEILYKMYIQKNGGETQELLNAAEAKLVDSVIKIGNNELSAALTSAQEATFYTTAALQKEPDSSVTQGAHFLAVGFQKIYEAFAAVKQDDATAAKSLIAEARNNAASAQEKDSSLGAAAGKLTELADYLEKSLAE